MRLGFDDFTLDSSTRELLRGDEPLHISPKGFELLRRLIEGSPRALAKREILELVWPATYVSESTMAAVIAEVRSVLGDPGYVRTVHRFGYAFRGEVRRLQDAPGSVAAPEYRLLWGNREISLGHGQNVVGRGRDSVAWIDDPSISRRHAVIFIADQQATVEDLASKNGTLLQGKKIDGQRTLNDGDRLVFGRVPMVFRVFRDGGPTQSIRST